jgi:hypothetical protein
VEALHKAAGRWPAHPGSSGLDVPPVRLPPAGGQAVEGEVERERVVLGPAELTAVVGQHGTNADPTPGVERRHLVVQEEGCRLRPLAGVQGGKAVAAKGVDHRLQVDLAETFEVADPRVRLRLPEDRRRRCPAPATRPAGCSRQAAL